MKTKSVIEFFGGVRETAEALSITTQAVYGWGEDVPRTRQGHIELASKGKLKRDKPVRGGKL